MLYSHLKAQLGRNILPSFFRLAEFISLWLYSWRPQLLIGYCLKAAFSSLREHSLPCHVGLPTSKTYYINVMQWHLIAFAIFCWLETNFSSHSTEIRGDYTRAWTLEAPTDLSITACMFMRDTGLPSSCLITPLSGFVIWVMQIDFENAFYLHVFLSLSFSTDLQKQIPGWIVDRNIWLKRIIEQ